MRRWERGRGQRTGHEGTGAQGRPRSWRGPRGGRGPLMGTELGQRAVLGTGRSIHGHAGFEGPKGAPARQLPPAPPPGERVLKSGGRRSPRPRGRVAGLHSGSQQSLPSYKRRERLQFLGVILGAYSKRNPYSSRSPKTWCREPVAPLPHLRLGGAEGLRGWGSLCPQPPSKVGHRTWEPPAPLAPSGSWRRRLRVCL